MSITANSKKIPIPILQNIKAFTIPVFNQIKPTEFKARVSEIDYDKGWNICGGTILFVLKEKDDDIKE